MCIPFLDRRWLTTLTLALSSSAQRRAAGSTAPQMRVALTTVTRVGLAAAACALLSGCGVLDRGFLSPAGPIAAETRQEFLFICLVMLFVIGPVLLLVPAIAWHYRLANTRSAFRPQWGFNWPLEGLIWLPPIGIVVLLAVFLWNDTHRLDPYKPLPGRTYEVEAIAADWKWIFIYPEEGVATVNRLVIPAGRPVHFSLTSATVMQSILMPRLAGQIYAMAGMRTELNLQADQPGRFLGENVQFNGMKFQDQKFTVDAMDPDALARWQAEIKAQPNRLDPAAYETLTRRSAVPQPLAFGAVDPGLFTKVVAQAQPSGHAIELRRLPPRPLPMGITQDRLHKQSGTP